VQNAVERPQRVPVAATLSLSPANAQVDRPSRLTMADPSLQELLQRLNGGGAHLFARPQRPNPKPSFPHSVA
jgi:hypothetical protein